MNISKKQLKVMFEQARLAHLHAVKAKHQAMVAVDHAEISIASACTLMARLQDLIEQVKP